MTRQQQTQPQPPARRLATMAQAADYAQVHPRTIRRWIEQGQLTGYRLGATSIRVDLNELDARAEPIPTASMAADIGW